MEISSPLPYVPSSSDRLKEMMELTGKINGLKAADLGSGDGRVVIELAKAGAKEVHGFEINPKLVLEAARKIEEAGLDGQVFIHLKDFFEADLNDFDVITGYWITSIMGKLEEKLQQELKPGSIVVSNYFTFPNWPHVQKQGSIYVYKKI